ncbi:hypothetical protein RI367_001446 [Sorochytrium milnesiophthora]
MEHAKFINADLPEHEIVENIIRSHVYHTRLRVVDLFRDFDRLRSGKLTRSQFRRCVSKLLERGPVLTEAQYDALVQHYDARNTGSIAYMAFADSIDRVFGEKNLEKRPTLTVPQPKEILKHPRPISAASLQRLAEIIERFHQYVLHHGCDVKSWFCDFDKHNNGLVTINQFERGIPDHLVDADEMEFLLRVCVDETTQTVNYFKLNAAVNKQRHLDKVDSALQLTPTSKQEEHIHPPIGTEALLDSVEKEKLKPFAPSDAQRKLMKHVYKRRLRLIDFFRDYDKHNHGVVTEAQFKAGLKLTELPLTLAEIQSVAQSYQLADGRIGYRDFCKDVEQVFTSDEVEKDPTSKATLELQDLLLEGPNTLSAEAEARCAEVLSNLQAQVRQRRLNMMSFFKEFDKRAGNYGQVTKAHFARLMSLLSLKVPEAHLYLLLDKYADPPSGHINYLNFISAIDPEWTSDSSKKSPRRSAHRPASPSSTADQLAVTGVQHIMDMIKYQCAIKGLRLSEAFRDYDRLRSGSVLRADMIRALDYIGLSLTPEECAMVADRYRDPTKPDKCLWRVLEQDVDVALGVVPNLERFPTLRPAPEPLHGQLASPVIEQKLSMSESYTLQQLLDDYRVHFLLRQTDVKEPFYNFDKLRTGQITKSQFRQVLSELGLSATEEELRILCKQFVNHGDRNPRFCYVPFVNELERSVEDDDGPIPKSSRALSAQTPSSTTGAGMTEEEIEQFLHRIKAKVKTERIRVLEYLKDYDLLRCGRITRSEFQRALTMLPFQISKSEGAVLQEMYASKAPGQANYIDYRRFSDDMDAVFTQKHFEGTPTAEPTEFKPLWHEHHSDRVKAWSAQDERDLSKLMHSVAEGLRRRRMFFVLRYLEDHDKIHKGTITRSQFRSALSAVGVPVTDLDAALIFRKYALEEYADDIDYLQFNDDLTEMSKKVWKGEAVDHGPPHTAGI